MTTYSSSGGGRSPSSPPFELWPFMSKHPNVKRQLEQLALKFRRQEISGPYDCAMATIELMRVVVGQCKWVEASQLMSLLKAVGAQLVVARQCEIAVGNMVRRALFIVREEYLRKVKSVLGCDPPSLEGLLGGTLPTDVEDMDMNVYVGDLKQPRVLWTVVPLFQSIAEGLKELKSELEDMQGIICDHAHQTIHANEVVLTYSRSSTVEAFLLAAAERYTRRGLKFSTVVCESAPYRLGHLMAERLASAGLEVTVIRDSAAFAVMARINKVIIPTHAVMANGGLIARSGGHVIAQAAREASVPVVCVTGLFKLCPIFPHDKDPFNILLSPSAVANHTGEENLEIVNPAYDYIPPELVDLYITNIGGHQPSYIYRLVGEYYHTPDEMGNEYM